MQAQLDNCTRHAQSEVLRSSGQLVLLGTFSLFEGGRRGQEPFHDLDRAAPLPHSRRIPGDARPAAHVKAGTAVARTGPGELPRASGVTDQGAIPPPACRWHIYAAFPLRSRSIA